MARLSLLLNNLLKRAGVDVTGDEAKELLTTVGEIEVSDKINLAALGNLFNSEMAIEKFVEPEKGKWKAENLNPIDTQWLEDYGQHLSDVEKTEFSSSKNTYEKMRKFNKLVLEKLTKEAKTANRDGDSGLASKYEGQIAELKVSANTTKQEFEKQLAEQKNQYTGKLLNTKIQYDTKTADFIADTFKKDRHFSRNFMADLEEYQRKNGVKLVYDEETDNVTVLKVDGTKQFKEDGTQYGYNDLLQNVADENGYRKLANESVNVQIDVPASSGNKDENSVLYQNLLNAGVWNT